MEKCESWPVIPDYWIKKKIGTGGFGKVYEAVSLKDNMEFAIKIIKKEKMKNLDGKSALERIEREIKIHAGLRHPSILKLHRYFQHEGNWCLVLDLCRRGDLESYLQEKKQLTEEEACKFLHEIVSGMLYLRNSKIMHRDIKPANFLLTEDLHIKIADFGLAKLLSPNDQNKTFCGTPNYIAPEILAKQPYDYKADVWSLGCLLYALLTGKPPFNPSHVGKYDVNIPQSVSHDAKCLILSLLNIDPQQRPGFENILNDNFVKKYMAGNSQVSNGYTHGSYDSGHGSLATLSTESSKFGQSRNYSNKPFLGLETIPSSGLSSCSINSCHRRPAIGSTVTKKCPSSRKSPVTQSNTRKPLKVISSIENGAKLASNLNCMSEKAAIFSKSTKENNNYNPRNASSPTRNQNFCLCPTVRNDYNQNFEINERSENIPKVPSYEYLNNDCGCDGSKNALLLNSRVGSASPKFSRQCSRDNSVEYDTEGSANHRPLTPSSESVRPVSPFNTTRLLPNRLDTPNAVFSILKDGEVSIEFLKANRKGKKVCKVCRISKDGKQILIYKPSQDEMLLQNKPPLAPGKHEKYCYKHLPKKHWKKYMYAARFVKFVKGLTPKIVYHSSQAKCMLMENSPDPDFEVSFYMGGKIKKKAEVITITDSSGRNIVTNEIGQNLDSDFAPMWNHFWKEYERCLSLEKGLKKLAFDTGSSVFPTRFSRKSLEDRSDNTDESNKENMSMPSNQKMPVADSAISYGASIQNSNQNKNFRSNIQHDSDIISNCSTRTSSRATPIRHKSKQSESYHVEKQFCEQDVGWGIQLSNGDILMYFNDGSQISSSSSGDFSFIDQFNKEIKFRYRDLDSKCDLPNDVTTKISQFNSMIKKLKSMQRNIF